MSVFHINNDTDNIANIICSKGDLFDVTFEFTDDSGDPFDFTDYELKAEIKRPDGRVFKDFDNDSIEVENNTVRMVWDAVDLQSSTYLWDLRMTKEGTSERIYKGTLLVNI